MRREGFRRPELLPPNAHSIDQSVIGDSMGMHDMGHGLEEVQVSEFGRFAHEMRRCAICAALKMQNIFFCMPLKQERKIWFALNMHTGNVNLERLHSNYIDRISCYHLMPLICKLLFFKFND